jgi:RHS repeat-associated protein
LAYNVRGQIIAVSDPQHPEANASFTYDANGNRETVTRNGVVTRYSWDARDRLMSLWRNEVLVARYRYHANNFRSEKETFGPGATLVRYHYDGPWIESETNAIGNVLVRYARTADGRILAVRHNDGVRYFLTNAQGTPTALLTLEGVPIARFAYDAWGNQVEHDGAENTPIRHTSHYFDEESGLYYLGARYYDPQLGAFISEDPVDGDVQRPITLNRYVAFNANPAVYTDPDGRCGLAVLEASECINNVAVAQGWDASRRLAEHEELREAEYRSAPAKLTFLVSAVLGGGLVSAIRAGVVAGTTGGIGWGVAVGTSRAAPIIEAGAQMVANVPGPGSFPTGPLSAGARVEAVAIQEARAASAASYADDVPRALATLPDAPPFPAIAAMDELPRPPPQASVLVEGHSGRAQAAPLPGVGPVGATGPPGSALSMETGPYRVMKDRTDIPGQAHHLNQDSMYRDHIPHGDAVTVKLEGDAFTEPGTPHYTVHQAQEQFLNQFRRGGERYGEFPSNLEMSRSMVDALVRAGYTKEQSMTLARDAIRDRLNYGLLGGEPVPRMPGRINQKKSEPTNGPTD